MNNFARSVAQNKLLSGLIVTVLILLLIQGLMLIGPFFAPLFFAFTITLLIYPGVQWLINKGYSHNKSVFLFVLAIVATFAAVFMIFYVSIGQLANNLPEYAIKFEQQIQPFVDFLAQYNLSIGFSTAEGGSWPNMQSFVAGLTSFLSGLMQSMVFAFFFLAALLMMVIGSNDVVDKFKKQLGAGHRFVVGFSMYASYIQKQYAIQTFSNFISAVAVTVELMLFRIDLALLWGLLTFLFGYIPNVGMVLAIIPAALLAFIEYGPWVAILLVVIAAILNQIMDNVVTPRFMGKGLELPVPFVFLSFLFWTWLFGPFGTLISLPLTLALRAIFANFSQTKLASQLLSGYMDEVKTETAVNKTH